MLNCGFDLAFLPVVDATPTAAPPEDRLRSMMLPAYGSGESSFSTPANSSPALPSHGVKGPVCGPPVPTFGTWLDAAELAPLAVPAEAVKTLTASTRTATRPSFVLPLNLILSPMKLDEAAAAQPPPVQGTHPAP